ncbi:hypothetical protein [Pantoea rodasii]|uniref:hypothetical protein n=1 Tax=Pantoea rodasii TaxID=1076549 RepID=UPI00138FF62E|nr:hypothetical protein [Pantoea rodasii]
MITIGVIIWVLHPQAVVIMDLNALILPDAMSALTTIRKLPPLKWIKIATCRLAAFNR